MFIVSRCHVMLFVLLTADPRKSTWLDIRMTCLTPHIVVSECRELVGVKRQRVVVHIFTLHYANTAHWLQISLPPLTLSLQHTTCVWDVSNSFKIVLVNASKVNAEENAKVNFCFVHIHEALIYVPVVMSLHTQNLQGPLCHVYYRVSH